MGEGGAMINHIAANYQDSYSGSVVVMTAKEQHTLSKHGKVSVIRQRRPEDMSLSQRVLPAGEKITKPLSVTEYAPVQIVPSKRA